MTALDRFYPQSDGSVVVAKSTGSALLYGAAGRPLVVESFDQARSLTVSGSTPVCRRFDVRRRRADLLNTANFGRSGRFVDSSWSGAGSNVVTLPALDRGWMFVLIFDDRIDGDRITVLEAIRAAEGRPGNRNAAVTGRCCLRNLARPFIPATSRQT